MTRRLVVEVTASEQATPTHLNAEAGPRWFPRRGWLPLVATLAAVAWIRLLPTTLPPAEAEAEALVRAQIESRFAAEVPRSLPPGPWSHEVATRTERWIAAHRERVRQASAALDRAIRDEMAYSGPGGAFYPYLGDVDSYHWLRLARNFLRSGTSCDAVVDGGCRDALALAPVGTRMLGRPLHVAAIAWVQHAVERLRPEQPLQASAMLVPVAVGTLAAAPAFALGASLGGVVGGLVAAVTSALRPQVLFRTIGSDDDVWSVVLPLLAVWATSVALDSRSLRRRLGAAMAAAAVLALQAATWRGWLFIQGVLGAGIVLHALLTARTPPRGARTAGPALLVLTILLAGGEVGGWLGQTTSFVGESVAGARALFAALEHPEEAALSDRDLWPDALRDVSEARPTDLGIATRSLDGPLGAAAAFAGLVLLLATEIRGARRRYRPSAAGILLVVWFLAALVLVPRSVRFLLLLAVPSAIACGVAVGRLHDASMHRGPRWRWIALAVAVGFLYLPLARGYAIARAYRPLMNDAWWETLEWLRDNSKPDAVIAAGWEAGYWTKYVAERRVLADGASLRTHVPVWIDRALATPSLRESAGILRLLACGSDATPFPEGALGGYGRLRGAGLDPLDAAETAAELARSSRAKAADLLASKGLSPPEAEGVLHATHCEPPDVYLVTSSDTATRPGWLRLGLWDFRRAYVREQARRHGDASSAARLISSRLGLGLDEARTLATEAASGDSTFVVPPRDYESPFVSARWIACSPPSDEGELRCPLDLADADAGVVLREFRYTPRSDAIGRIRLETSDPGGLSGEVFTPPSALLLAHRNGVTEVPLAQAAETELAVLLDTDGRRILVGSAAYLRSAFVRLHFLDGRAAPYFEKLRERSTVAGSRLVVWRVHWPQEAQ